MKTFLKYLIVFLLPVTIAAAGMWFLSTHLEITYGVTPTPTAIAVEYQPVEVTVVHTQLVPVTVVVYPTGEPFLVATPEPKEK